MAKSTGNADLDKFLAEIDRLRKKSDSGSSSSPPPPPPPPRAKAVPVAKPAQPKPKKRVVDDPPPSPPTVQIVSSSQPSFADQPKPVPVAKVAKQAKQATQPQFAELPTTPTVQTSASVTKRVVIQSNVGRSIATMLSNKQDLAAAMALQIVLGPPVCRKKPGE